MFPDGIYAYGTTWYASTYSPGLGITTDGGATWTWRGAAQGVQARPRDAWFAP